jgi:hypothetical protein
MISDIIQQKAKEAVMIPATFGHGDIGDVLVSVLQGETNEDQALQEIEWLRESYAGEDS